LKNDIFVVPDGLQELKHEMQRIIDLIASTARWVHPDTFRALPVGYPETARGEPIFNAKWDAIYRNTSRSTSKVTDKSKPNIKAGKAFVAALSAQKKLPDLQGWTV
jgi:hypothetical protein